MKSKFTGGLFGLIGINVLAVLLSVFTLFIGTPWAVCMVERWYAKHTTIDGKQLVFDGKGHQLWGRIFLWVILVVITVGLFSFWLGIAYKKWATKHTHFLLDEENLDDDKE